MIKSAAKNALVVAWVIAAEAGATPLQDIASQTGHIHALTIFARFANESGLGREPPSFAAEIFTDQPGSLTHFYREMSRGQFELTGEVLPRRYASRSTADSYADMEAGYGRFAREIIEAADADVDFSRYDNDGPDGVPNSGDDDGYVDYIFIVSASAPPGFIVGDATGVARLGLSYDFVSQDRALHGGFIQIQSKSGSVQRGKNFADAVGIMAHEFGHFLGLPDLYDLDRGSEPAHDSGGIGYWGLMAHGIRGWDEISGPNPFCAWSLGQLGWLGVNNQQLKVLSEDQDDVVFADVNAGGDVYLLPASAPAEHFFLVEFRSRQHSYYERNLPGEGLLIWRINPNRNGNNMEAIKQVDLVCADGLFRDAGFPLGRTPAPFSGRDNLDFWAHDDRYRTDFGGNLGDATDVFDGEQFTDFWAASNPASTTGVSVTRIRREGDRMVADLKLQDHRRAGPITDMEIWRDRIEIVGDVTVLPGGHLDVRTGAEVLVGPDALAAGADTARVELIVYGDLIVGISGQERIVFRSAAADPQPGDWQGIVLQPTASVYLRSVHIDHARYGLLAEKLDHTITLEDVAIRHAGEDGIRLENIEEEVVFDRVQVEESGGVGIWIAGAGLMRINQAELHANGRAGLWREGGYLSLLDSRFNNNGSAEPEEANLVLGRGASGKVVGNSFAGGIGIYCVETREVEIEDNALYNHEVGLWSRSARPRIVRNQFFRNALALRVEGSVVPARLVLNGVQEGEQLIDNQTDQSLQAINNWWGNEDESWIEARISGDVNWQPFLNFDSRIPLNFALGQNYPNPFNEGTQIDYQIGINDPIVAGQTMVELEVRTLTGGLVRHLVEGLAAPGLYSTSWDGRDERGERVASGMYYYVLRIGPIVHAKKMVFVK
ncbi:MAG: M6 family metalloprotease domain-containing protein [Gemmatimonadetes bacterium]|nr:M6 family metalloprotease domain-containing protein [Gemmatimonadota bacterium]